MIYAEKQNTFPAVAEPTEILLIRLPRIKQRIVYECDRRPESQMFNMGRQLSRGSNELIARARHNTTPSVRFFQSGSLHMR